MCMCVYIYIYIYIYIIIYVPLGAQVVKNLPANAGDARDTGSVSGSGRSPGEGNSNPVQVWKIPWTEEPGRLRSMGSAELDVTK